MNTQQITNNTRSINDSINLYNPSHENNIGKCYLRGTFIGINQPIRGSSGSGFGTGTVSTGSKK